jgi:hypothetical protein
MLKRVFLLIVILLLIGAGYAFAVRNELLSKTTLPTPVSNILERLSLETPQVAEQTQQLSQRAQELGAQTQQVLGTAIETVPEDTRPVANKAIEYGKYLYCKQVVLEYEKEVQK